MPGSRVGLLPGNRICAVCRQRSIGLEKREPSAASPQIPFSRSLSSSRMPPSHRGSSVRPKKRRFVLPKVCPCRITRIVKSFGSPLIHVPIPQTTRITASASCASRQQIRPCTSRYSRSKLSIGTMPQPISSVRITMPGFARSKSFVRAAASSPASIQRRTKR